MTAHERAQSVLAMVRDVHERAPLIMGSPSIVHDELAAPADKGDVDAMVTYFQPYKGSTRGVQLRKRLEAFGRETLESQERQFLAIARSV